jgi:hypothetical protein
MTAPADQDEITARLAAIANGPWNKAGKRAYKFLEPPAVVDEARIQSREVLNLRNDRSSGKRSSKISNVLRAHWDKIVEDTAEINIRDSLDEALTTLQLWELAVSSGYLPLEAVRVPARRALANLLWSEGARTFIQNYGYATIPFLAERVGIQLGSARRSPPAPSTTGGQRFASFLAEIRAWETDRDLGKWLRFLDGFREMRGAGDQLKKLLSASAPDPRYLSYLASLLAGAQTFRLRLSDFAETLEHDERPLYGSYFAYLLARFHGFLAGKEGYHPVKTNWSAEFARAFDKDKTQRHQTLSLQSLWDETLEFLQPTTRLEPAEREVAHHAQKVTASSQGERAGVPISRKAASR